VGSTQRITRHASAGWSSAFRWRATPDESEAKVRKAILFGWRGTWRQTRNAALLVYKEGTWGIDVSMTAKEKKRRVYTLEMNVVEANQKQETTKFAREDGLGRREALGRNSRRELGECVSNGPHPRPPRHRVGQGRRRSPRRSRRLRSCPRQSCLGGPVSCGSRQAGCGLMRLNALRQDPSRYLGRRHGVRAAAEVVPRRKGA
jgi:hypothetical protein